jgi:5-methylcytosine-specific restriction enzyme A
MAKLTNLKPRIGTLAPRFGYTPGDEKARDRYRVETDPSRRWYRTSRWRTLRQTIFLRDLYTCRMCGKIEGNTSLLVCDHKQPHKGSETLFWSPENLQTLCASPCHNSLKQRLDKRGLQP